MMDRTAWDAAVHKYELAVLLETACRDFGPGSKIRKRYRMREMQLENLYGKRENAAHNPRAAQLFDEAVVEYDAAMDGIYVEYCDPVLEAAQVVTLVDAPDAEAVRFKIELINSRDLECFEGTEHIFDVVRADVERLAAQ